MALFKINNAEKRNTVFAYDIDTRALSLVNHALISRRKFGAGVLVAEATVADEIVFPNSGRVVNNKSRRFWLMATSSQMREELGKEKFVPCDQEGSIASLGSFTRQEKRLFREARDFARAKVGPSCADSDEEAA